MLFLIVNVCDHVVTPRIAHAECPETLLPSKIMNLLCSSILKNSLSFSELRSSTQAFPAARSTYNTVGHASNGEDVNVKILSNAGHVSPKLLLTVVRNALCPILGAENDIDEDVAIGMSHGMSSLRDSDFIPLM
jgi:hypothetical protein